MHINNFRAITIFTNRLRVRRLEAFRELVQAYYADADAEPLPRPRGRVDGDRVKELRRQINMARAEACTFVRAADVVTMVLHLPAPAVGGYRMNIDIFTEFFNLADFSVEGDRVIDCIDTSIGIYDADKTAATIRTFNPLWWFGRALSSITQLPFMVLAAAGINTEKIEQSLIGKLIKSVVWLLSFIATVITLWNVIR